MAWTKGTKAVMIALGLTLSEVKTKLKDARKEHFDFLGNFSDFPCRLAECDPLNHLAFTRRQAWHFVSLARDTQRSLVNSPLTRAARWCPFVGRLPHLR